MGGSTDDPPGPGRYRFGDIVVDEAAHTLLRAGEPQAVEPKAFAVLLALLRRPGELIARDDLLDQVWGHRHVTPGVLTRAIAQLRNVLGDDHHQPRYIQTRHALGYSFVGELLRDECTDVESLAGARSADAEETREPLARDESRQAPPPTGGAVPERRLAPHHGFAWRPRHWLLASLLASAVFAISVWSARQVSPKPEEASIAVLPFSNLSGDADNDYFAEGLAVEMHDALAGVRGLKVAAQLSPAAAASREADVRALGQRLGVATVLDASVRREGGRVRINARLSDTRTGFTLWSRSYDRELSGIFEIQSEIADEVVQALLDVLPGERHALAGRLTPTSDFAAFDLYLKGVQRLSRAGPGAGEDAVGLFNRALAEDSGFARAQAGICLSQVFRFQHERIADAYEAARTACARAQALDPGSGVVNLALAKLHHAKGELGEATKFYARAEADPARRADAFVGLALIHGDQGRHAEALEYLGRAVQASPGNDVVHSYIGYYHYLTGDIPGAIAAFRKAIELQPEDEGYWSTLGTLYANAGDNAAAARALARSLEIEPNNHLALNNLGELRYQSGDYAAAADLYRKATLLQPDDYIPWGNLGRALLADEATTYLARAAFMEAARHAGDYVALKPDDATGLAALGWFSANLGQAEQARELVGRSEALRGEPIEVALYNAMTFASLGEIEQSRERVAVARAAGLPETRIATNAVLRRAGVVAGPPLAESENDAVPARRDDGHPPGE